MGLRNEAWEAREECWDQIINHDPEEPKCVHPKQPVVDRAFIHRRKGKTARKRTYTPSATRAFAARDPKRGQIPDADAREKKFKLLRRFPDSACVWAL
jgi:hypothetical protein